jgi:hypothetical protein
VKKGRKKEDNGFKYLEKCLSSTSPSNFMMNYMAQGNHQESSRVKQERGQVKASHFTKHT